ncbi:NPCBM/NEW2 domain-containing protein [Oerskovia sp. M15]
MRVKLGAIASDASATVVLAGTSAVGGKDSDAGRASVTVAWRPRSSRARRRRRSSPSPTPAPRPSPTWSSNPSSRRVDAREQHRDDGGLGRAGASVTARVVVSPAAGSAAGQQTVGARATYRDAAGDERMVSGANQLYVAYGTLAAAFNHVSVTSLATKDAGNFDGGEPRSQRTRSRRPGPRGRTLTVTSGDDTIEYTWPAAAPGSSTRWPSTVRRSRSRAGHAPRVPRLGVRRCGRHSRGDHHLRGWHHVQAVVLLPELAAPGRLERVERRGPQPGPQQQEQPGGYEYPTYKYQVYSDTVILNPAKELRSVTFPVQTNAKLFAMKVATLGLPEAPQGTVWASDLTWTSATNGYGVIGKDVANKDMASSPDKPLVINTTPELKKTYAKGLGVHAASKITYYLGGQCTRFTADAGLEDLFKGSVIFRVDVDGANKYQGTTFQAGFPTEQVSVDVTGAQYIDLIVDPTSAGAINGAHGVWGDARFVCAEPVAFAAEASSTKSGATVLLSVRTVNQEEVPVDVVVTTPYGTKTFVGVLPGKSASQSFSARAATVPAGRSRSR